MSAFSKPSVAHYIIENVRYWRLVAVLKFRLTGNYWPIADIELDDDYLLKSDLLDKSRTITESRMYHRLCFILAVVNLLFLIGPAHGLSATSEIVTMQPDELEWKQTAIGWEVATLLGDMSSNDTSIVRLRMPPNWSGPPNTHKRTELEVVSIRSGTVYISFGENVVREDARTFVPGAFIAYPAGVTVQFYTEEEEVLVDVFHLRDAVQVIEDN